MPVRDAGVRWVLGGPGRVQVELHLQSGLGAGHPLHPCSTLPCFHPSFSLVPCRACQTPQAHTTHHHHTTAALPSSSHPTGPEFTRPTDKQPPLHQLAVGPRSTHSLSTRGLSSHSHAAHTFNNWAAVPQTATLFCTSGRNVPQEGKTIPSLVPPPHALARHFHAASTFGRLS